MFELLEAVRQRPIVSRSRRVLLLLLKNGCESHASRIGRSNSRAAGVKPNNPGFVRTKSTLSRCAHVLRICLRPECILYCARTCGGGSKDKKIAALAVRCTQSQDRIDQTGGIRGRRAGSGAAEDGEAGGVSIGPSRLVDDLRCYDGANSAHRGSFIGRHARPKQVRNCNGRDDQNNGYDDQQLD
jgi:hypothetical protein